MTMLAPSRAALSAIASPMPREPPEMKSVLPLRSVMAGSSLLSCDGPARPSRRALQALLRTRFLQGPHGEEPAQRASRTMSVAAARRPSERLRLQLHQRFGAGGDVGEKRLGLGSTRAMKKRAVATLPL